MMERLGCTMAGAPSMYGWHAVAQWARHLPEGSATFRARHRDAASWSSDLGRAAIMADQFDALARIIETIAKAAGATTRPPKPYPRPWRDDGERKIGGGAIPVADFDAWFYQDEQ